MFPFFLAATNMAVTLQYIKGTYMDEVRLLRCEIWLTVIFTDTCAVWLSWDFPHCQEFIKMFVIHPFSLSCGGQKCVDYRGRRGWKLMNNSLWYQWLQRGMSEQNPHRGSKWMRQQGKKKKFPFLPTVHNRIRYLLQWTHSVSVTTCWRLHQNAAATNMESVDRWSILSTRQLKYLQSSTIYTRLFNNTTYNYSMRHNHLPNLFPPATTTNRLSFILWETVQLTQPSVSQSDRL